MQTFRNPVLTTELRILGAVAKLKLEQDGDTFGIQGKMV